MNPPIKSYKQMASLAWVILTGMVSREELEKPSEYTNLYDGRCSRWYHAPRWNRKKYEVAKEKFEKQFMKERNIIYEWAKFNSRRKEDEETVDLSMAALYTTWLRDASTVLYMTT